MLSLGEFLSAKNLVGTASFYHTIPEQIHAMVRDEVSVSRMKDNVGKQSNHYKNDIYTSHFDIPFREKYTGFESLKEKDAEYRNKFKSIQNPGDIHHTDVICSLSDLNSETSITAFSSLSKFDKSYELKDTISFKEACLKAARYIHENTDREIFMCMSGGADSELAACAFKEAGIPFKAFIMNYNNGSNEFDIKYAKAWCIANDVEYIEYAFDIDAFFENEMLEYFEFSKVTSPQILTYQKMLTIVNEEFNAYPVLGGEFRFMLNEEQEVCATYAWDKHETPHGGSEK